MPWKTRSGEIGAGPRSAVAVAATTIDFGIEFSGFGLLVLNRKRSGDSIT
jgi:hypothetical protein